MSEQKLHTRAKLVKFLDILLISILQIKPILVNKVIKPHRNTAAELSQEIIN